MSSSRVGPVAVESSLLISVDYDANNLVLKLVLRSGTIYHYFDVPRPTYEALLASQSKGAYFNNSIRGHFAYVALPE